ncbi:MAG: hypothetical protein ABIP29_02115 [Candidatus Eisenbacteria bacterium]
MKRSLLLSIVLTALMALASALAIGPAAAVEANLRIAVPGATAYTFNQAPTWSVIPGTRVYAIQGTSRPDFDVFRHGSYYYAYRGGNWYRAKSWNGQYRPVQDRYLPAQFNVVSREHWRAYPPGWEKRAAKVKVKTKAKGNAKNRY